jgi:hypothetical protein
MSDQLKGRAIWGQDCHRDVSGWSFDCTTCYGQTDSGASEGGLMLRFRGLVLGLALESIERKTSASHCKTSAEPGGPADAC